MNFIFEKLNKLGIETKGKTAQEVFDELAEKWDELEANDELED